MKVVEEYPDNEFIFLPQTVCFESMSKMQECVAILKGKRATICARDMVSYEILKENFRNKILLVPDMAYCIDMKRWASYIREPESARLLLKREDKELKPSYELNELERSGAVDISDWVTFRGDNCCERNFNRLRRFVSRRPMRELGAGPFLIGLYMRYIYRPFLIRGGIRQLSGYSEIYTTRLHAGILGMLLNRRVKFFDNSYGKNRHFYETWLEDCDAVEFLR